MADAANEAGKRVFRCSTTDRSADVCRGRITGGERAGPACPFSSRASWWAKSCRSPLASSPPTWPARWRWLCRSASSLRPSSPGCTIFRRSTTGCRRSSPSGVIILDDTYNSNPAGAAAAFGRWLRPRTGMGRIRPAGPPRLAVVTPGMVELGARPVRGQPRVRRGGGGGGHRPGHRGADQSAGARGGRTGSAPVPRPESPWSRIATRPLSGFAPHLASGDAVLYENDLPDHYP